MEIPQQKSGFYQIHSNIFKAENTQTTVFTWMLFPRMGHLSLQILHWRGKKKNSDALITI